MGDNYQNFNAANVQIWLIMLLMEVIIMNENYYMKIWNLNDYSPCNPGDATRDFRDRCFKITISGKFLSRFAILWPVAPATSGAVMWPLFSSYRLNGPSFLFGKPFYDVCVLNEHSPDASHPFFLYSFFPHGIKSSLDRRFPPLNANILISVRVMCVSSQSILWKHIF